MLDSQIISHNSTQPLVTFIITTYNLNAELLKECVESITKLSTSIDEREIIVIDDGSDLPALNSLTSVCKNIVYLWQPNNGASAARNIGLDIAHGVVERLQLGASRGWVVHRRGRGSLGTRPLRHRGRRPCGFGRSHRARRGDP